MSSDNPQSPIDITSVTPTLSNSPTVPHALTKEYLSQYQVAIHHNIDEITLFLHNFAQWTAIYHTLSLSAKCTLENELLTHLNTLIQKTESLMPTNGI